MDSSSKDYPHAGETIILCIHCVGDNKPSPLHWFLLNVPTAFIRPGDGSTGSARWLAICKECFTLFQIGVPLAKLPMGCDEILADDVPSMINPEVN